MPHDDAFTLLGLPRTFDIDRRALQAAWLRRTAALHPDRISDPIAQAEAQRAAAALNDARAVLADDESRANLLLALAGGPPKEADKNLPDGFLVDVLEIRQEMEEALAGDDPGERARIERLAADRRRQHVAAVREMFASLGAQPAPCKLAAIRRELNAWRYIERMIDQLRDA